MQPAVSSPAARLCSSSSCHGGSGRHARPARQRYLVWSYHHGIIDIISMPVTFLWCLGTGGSGSRINGGVSGSAPQPPAEICSLPCCRGPGTSTTVPQRRTHEAAIAAATAARSHSGGDVTHQQKQVTATLHGFFPGVVLTPCRRGRHAGHRKEVAPAERTRSAGTT